MSEIMYQNKSYGGTFENAVSYKEQALSEEDKAQARRNIDAISSQDVDTAMSSTSENPVMNKVIKDYIDEKIMGKIKTFSLPYGTSRNITFSQYSCSAIIAAADAMYHYNNGYLHQIKTSSKIQASLSANYKVITIKNTSTTENYYATVVSPLLDFVVS